MSKESIAAAILLLSPASGPADDGPRRWIPRGETAEFAGVEGRRDEDLDELRSKGIRLAQAGELLAARRCFEEGLIRARSLRAAAYTARFLTNLANVDFLLHQHRAAMAAYLEARALAEAAGERELAAIAGANVAWLYAAGGSYEDARFSLEQAMRLLPLSARPAHRGRMHQQSAMIKIRLGQWNEATKSIRRALDLADQEGSLELTADILDGLGYELLRAGRWRSAEPLVLEAFRLRRIHSLRITGQVWRNLGLLKQASGNLAAAERFVKAAIETERKTPDFLPLWVLYESLAAIQIEDGRRAEALENLEAALEEAGRLRTALLPAESVRLHAGAGLQSLFRTYVDQAALEFEAGGGERWLRRAFEVSQQGRAMTLAELRDRSAGEAGPLGAEYWDAVQRLHAAERAAAVGRSDRRLLAALRHRLTMIEVAAGLRGGDSALLEGVSAARVQGGLGRQEAFIAFALTANGSYRWALTRERVEFDRLSSPAALERLSAAFRQDLVAGDTPAARRSGRRLYEALFAGLSLDVQAKKHWILAPDGDLLTVPYAALAPGDGGTSRYLIEERSVRVTPGAALRFPSGRPSWEGGLLAVGDPIYNAADPRLDEASRQQAPGRLRFPLLSVALPPVEWMQRFARPDREPTVEAARLAGTSREVQAAAAAWSETDHRATVLTGKQARLSSLLHALDARPAAVHLATHILAGRQDSSARFIALSRRSDGSPEMLSAAAIAMSRSRPRLVVMTGCDSGTGYILPGEGMMGLTRAWLRAGSRQVIATLWPVPDDAGELITSFYRALLGAPSANAAPTVHEALREAQIRMISAGGWRANPRYWAAPFLVSSD